jgi:glycosyltransferase involved in cell wall biosynthesis
MALPSDRHDPYHRWLYREVDRFIAVTRALAEQARARLPLPADRILQFYPGVPPCPAQRGDCGLRSGPFQLGLFGRVEPAKGQHLLVEALERLGRPDIHAAIVGHVMDPAYRRRLAQQVAAAGMADRVRFHDFVPDPMACMQAFDAVVLTTENETFGLVLPEAMRCGVAVIGSDAGGVREIIDDGRTGLLFRPGDAASLAEGIGRLYDDAALRSRLAAAGRARAARTFDRDTQFGCLRRILQECAPGRCR